MDWEATSPASSVEVRHDLGPPGTSSGRDGCAHKGTGLPVAIGSDAIASYCRAFVPASVKVSCMHVYIGTTTSKGPLADGAGGGSTAWAARNAPAAAADTRHMYFDMSAC
jgi:hypothetical protein